MKPQDTVQQHAILRQSGIARAFDTVAEAAQQVSAILAATARSRAQPERLVMTDARTATEPAGTRWARGGSRLHGEFERAREWAWHTPEEW